jgi:hypothetical protein
LTAPAYDKSTIICRAELPPQLQQRRFELQKCAQQLVRMNNVPTTIVAMSVNDPTPAISGNGGICGVTVQF